MTTENENTSFVDDWVDDGMNKAGIEADDPIEPEEEAETTEATPEAESKTQETEEAATEQPTDKETPAEEVQETPEQEESAIEQVLPETSRRVPLDDHIKLRQRAQGAEQRVRELEQQQAETAVHPTGGEIPGVKESPLAKFVRENPDDELVPASVQLEQAEFLENKRAVERQAIEDRQQEQEQTDHFTNRAIASEKVFKAATPDYGDITSAAMELKVITIEDAKVIQADKNPAKKLYEISKAKVSARRKALGITVPATPTTPTEEKEETPDAGTKEGVLTDDNIINEIYS